MSTATEITRLTGARNTIRDKLIDLGLATSTSKLDELADAIDDISNRGAVSATVQEGDTYTIPAGYHNGSGTVSGVAGGGNYSLQSKSITPTKSQQSVTPDNGYYGLSDVTVAPIPEAYQNVSSVTATAADVLASKVFVNSSGQNVTGTMVNNGHVDVTLRPTSSTYSVPAGYHGGMGIVRVATFEQTVTPREIDQQYSNSNGFYSQFTVKAIPKVYGNTSEDDAVAANILSGVKAHSYNSTNESAVQLTGTMPNRGAVSATLDATTNKQTYTVPAGYHNGNGTVSITLESKSATPTESSQTITPTSGKVLSSVTVNAIPSNYADTSDADAVAANILSGVKAYSYDEDEEEAVAVTGTMPNRGAVSKSLDATTGNQSYTVPAGYHNGSGAVSITLETKSATPTKSSQTITPSTGKVLSSVTVNAIPAAYQDVTSVDAAAGDVLSGKKIVSSSGTVVTGTMTDNGTVTHTLDATTNNQSYTIPAGKHSGSGSVNIVLEQKSATPSASSQNITPTSGKVLSSVTVNAIPSNWGNTTGDTAVAANLLYGIKAHTIENGTAIAITGTMANNGAISATIDGITVTSYSVPAGYTSGGTVSLTNDIETALAAI